MNQTTSFSYRIFGVKKNKEEQDQKRHMLNVEDIESNDAEYGENDNLTAEHLIRAASAGRFWLVRKCAEAGIPLDSEGNRALQRAVYNGRTTIVKYLLDNGCSVGTSVNAEGVENDFVREILSVACKKGYIRILELLLTYDPPPSVKALQCAFIDAVKHGNTRCVNILLDKNVDVHVDNDLALLEACRNRHINIIDILIKAGAYVNCRDGQPLIESSRLGYNDVVEVLIKHGADVSINDDAALKAAVENRHVLIIISLLNNGGDISVLDSCDETLRAVIKAFARQSVFSRLRKAIHNSLSNQVFKWQTLCSCRNPDMEALRKQADLINVPYGDKDNKVSICAKLALNYEKNLSEKEVYDDHLTDFTGTPINDLPFWKIIVIEGKPFNCFDLFKLVKNGYMSHPYTRTPLPIDDIRKHEQYLRSILTTHAFKDENFLENVKQSPILTDTMVLRNTLENEVWDKLAYTPPLSIIMDATDGRINEMMDKLVIICKRKSLFEILSPGLDIYPMLQTNVITKVKQSKGLEKKKAFVEVLSSMANLEDDHRDTRRVSISIMLKTFTNGNNNGEDDFTFMVGNGSSDTDDYDDTNLNIYWWDDDS